MNFSLLSCPGWRQIFRHVPGRAALGISALLLISGTRAMPAAGAAVTKIPVLVDTDIGDDFDDSWALGVILCNPHLDLQLVTTTYGKSDYRAQIIACYLNAAGRKDVMVGLGSNADHDTGENLGPWLREQSLEKRQVTTRPDAAAAMIEMINKNPGKSTVIELGPMETLAAALKIDPTIASKAHLVAMLGSVRVGYGNKPRPSAEYNVVKDIPAAQRVLSAPWVDVTVAPLDTAGNVRFEAPHLAKLRQSAHPLVVALLSSYEGFIKSFAAERGRELLEKDGYPPPEAITFGNPGYDIVGACLADPADRTSVRLENLRLEVTDKGFTKISDHGKMMSVATSWADKEKFSQQAVEMLTK